MKGRVQTATPSHGVKTEDDERQPFGKLSRVEVETSTSSISRMKYMARALRMMSAESSLVTSRMTMQIDIVVRANLLVKTPIVTVPTMQRLMISVLVFGHKGAGSGYAELRTRTTSRTDVLEREEACD